MHNCSKESRDSESKSAHTGLRLFKPKYIKLFYISSNVILYNLKCFDCTNISKT